MARSSVRGAVAHGVTLVPRKGDNRARTMPPRRARTSDPLFFAVCALGLAQITAWGTSYYCLGVLAGPIGEQDPDPRLSRFTHAIQRRRPSLVAGAFPAASADSGCGPGSG